MQCTRIYAKGLLAASFTISLMTLSLPVRAATVTNGDFETGDFTGWTTVVQPGSNGDVFVTDSNFSPTSFSAIPGGNDGSSIAVTDQNGPGSYVLFQDIALEIDMTHSLGFDWFAQSHAPFSDAGTLDLNEEPNQHFRVDLVDANFTDWFGPDANAGVLANLIAPVAEASPVSGFNSSSFDLTPWAGNTVRLAFREVDNQFFFQAGVDNVNVTSESQKVPEPSSILGALLGLGILGSQLKRSVA